MGTNATNRLEKIQARYGSISQVYIDSLKPSLQKFLIEDVPLLIELVDAAVRGREKQFADVAMELLQPLEMN
jgi:hypothetical protein